MGLQRSAWGLVVFVCAISGCVDYVTVDEGMSAPVVVSVVLAGRDSVFLALGTAGPGTQTGPEPGAELVLVTPHGDLSMAQSHGDPGPCGGPPGFSCYVVRLPVPVSSGDSVRLVGRLRSGTEVRGGTVVPGIPAVSMSGRPPGDTIRFEDRTPFPPSVVVGQGQGRVTLSDSTVRVTVWAAALTRDCWVPVNVPDTDLDLRQWYFTSTLRLAVGGPVCDGERLAAWDSLAGSVAFLGFDDHATQWYETRDLVWPDEGGAQGVEGALGLFGAATPAVFVIHVTGRTIAPSSHLEVGP